MKSNEIQNINEELIKKALEIKKTFKAYGDDYRHLDDLLIEVKELIRLILK